jgi:hypothetical protein
MVDRLSLTRPFTSPSSSLSSSAGTLPDDLHLDERLADISREALKRREAESREWESEDEAAAPSSTDSSAKKKSKKDELHTSPGSHPGPTIVTAPHAAAAALDVDDAAVADVNLADPAVKGSLTPEQKHRVFAKKRDINYGKMGNLLKKHHDDDEEEE